MSTNKNKYGADRFKYLQELVDEFQESESQEAKQQVLANLGNFAYDPGNFESFYRLNVIDLFLDQLNDEQLTEYAICGICNLCADERNREYILNERSRLNSIIKCLSSENEECVVSAITSLLQMFWNNKNTAAHISPQVVECLLRYSESTKRLSNVSNLFINNHCSNEQINEARMLQCSIKQSAPRQISNSKEITD